MYLNFSLFGMYFWTSSSERVAVFISNIAVFFFRRFLQALFLNLVIPVIFNSKCRLYTWDCGTKRSVFHLRSVQVLQIIFTLKLQVPTQAIASTSEFRFHPGHYFEEQYNQGKNTYIWFCNQEVPISECFRLQ